MGTPAITDQVERRRHRTDGERVELAERQKDALVSQNFRRHLAIKRGVKLLRELLTSRRMDAELRADLYHVMAALDRANETREGDHPLHVPPPVNFFALEAVNDDRGTLPDEREQREAAAALVG